MIGTELVALTIIAEGIYGIKKKTFSCIVEILKEAARGGATFSYAPALEAIYKKLVELRADANKA